MNTYFVSSDIHSAYTIWMSALKEKGFDIQNPNHIIILCGDLFDRMDEPAECYYFAKKLKKENRLIYIRGNHESLLLECVQELQETRGCTSPHHYSNGTVDTILQFQKVGILEEVLDFLKKNTVYYYELGNYLFIHAGVPIKTVIEGEELRTVLKSEAESKEWEKHTWDNPFENWIKGNYPSDKTIVCGHWGVVEFQKIYHHLGSGKYDIQGCYDTFVDDNIIALDATTIVSKKINVLVLEESSHKCLTIK